MNRRVAALAVPLAVLLFAPACTQHPQVATLRPPAPGVEAVASLASGDEVEVVATTTPAGLRWVTRAKVVPTVIDPADMRSYSTPRRGRAIVAGLAIGAFTGVVVGGAVGFAAGCSDNTCRVPSDTAAGYGAVALGSVGLVVGALTGLLVGSRDVHELATTERMPRVSATASHGGATAALSWSY